MSTKGIHHRMPFVLVGGKGLEPSTPALSKQCSEPTELTTQNNSDFRFMNEE